LQPVWRNDGAGAGSGGIYTFTSVGVGTSAQTSFFEVYGSSKFRTGVVTFTNSGDTDIIRITDGGLNVISGITTIGGALDCNGNLDVDGTDHDIVGTIALDNVQVSAGATIEGNLIVTGAASTSSIAGALQLTNVNVSGTHTAGFAVVTNDLTVNGNMTVNGTTTTLDSVVQEVDLMNIQANSSTPGLGVTQSGSGAIIAAYDGASEVFRIADGGNTGVGTASPSQKLHVSGGQAIFDNGSNFFINSASTATVLDAKSGVLRLDMDGTERLRITSGGNVNIGGNYTQTTYTSQITGTLNVTGDITQNGATVTTTGKSIAMSMIFG
jgi:cytoskeletal protein CcmA (bactofilin family)